MNAAYLLLIIVSTVIGFGAQGYVRSQIRKYSDVPTASGLTGAEMARRMLSDKGIPGLPIHRGGEDQDHFDPRSNSITLDPHAFGAASITAIATACHEVGHADQFNNGYLPMKVRSALVPVVQLSSNAWMLFLLAGIFLNMVGLIDIAIILFAFVVLFQVVTLPVEFNASRRAMEYLSAQGLPAGETAGAFNVLRACALTYVAAALVSALQLVWLVSQRD